MYINSFIQSRAASLSKQLSDIHEQVEQSFVELNTFEGLRSQELQAIPRRTQVCSLFVYLSV